MAIGEKLKIISANCQGLRDKNRRVDVIGYLCEQNSSIICLQDTHITVKDENNVRQLSNCECILGGSSTNSRGVAILLKNNFEFEVLQTEADPKGNYLCVDLKMTSFSIRIINIYAPSLDEPIFFENLQKLVENNSQNYLIICGDFNLVLDPTMDTYNYVNINNPRSRKYILEMIELYNLKDTYRALHPQVCRYTWRRKHPIKQAHLDYFIVSESFMDIIDSCKINPGYRSDQSFLERNLIINPFHKGPGISKFNCELLKHSEYI